MSLRLLLLSLSVGFLTVSCGKSEKVQKVIFEGSIFKSESGYEGFVRQRCRENYPDRVGTFLNQGWVIISSSPKSHSVPQGVCEGTEYILQKEKK